MDSRQFWNAVDRELDAGRDPLDRQALAGWLADHPEELEEFADLRAGLAVLSDSAPPPKARAPATARPRLLGWPLFVAAAAALLAVLAAVLVRAGRPPAPAVIVHRLTVTFESDGRLQGAESRPGRHGTFDSLPSTGGGPLLRLSVRTEEEHTEEEP